jgi:dUTP pyrophosphatase
MKLKVQRLSEAALLPQYATYGAACFDLCAAESGWINAGTQKSISTGLAFEVPEGHVMLVFSRSGHGFKSGVRLVNSVGVIDSDYRGEVLIGLRNDSPNDFPFEECARLAQAMIIPIPRVDLIEVNDLSETTRGTGGLGSTGA